MEITEVGLFVTLVYARNKKGSVKQVIAYLARPEKEGGLGLLEDESKDGVWHNVEKNISAWSSSEPQVREVELLHLSFELREEARRDWSIAQDELQRAMTGLTSLPVGRTLLYLAALSDGSKLDEGRVVLKAAQIRGSKGQTLTSILALTEVAGSRLYLLSSASEGQEMVYLALEKEEAGQKISKLPFFGPYAALSRANTIAHQFYSQAKKYLSHQSRQTLQQATNVLMTNAIEMLLISESSDSTTFSQLNAQVASLVKMTADLRALDSQLERLLVIYDGYVKGNQGLASLLAYHRQQMNSLYVEIGAELKEANLALETGNRAMSTLRLNYERLQAEEGRRLNEIEKVRARDAERAMREQTEAIRQQTMLIGELLQREKDRAAQEARAAKKKVQLERERRQQELRVTQEQLRREEEQALEQFRAIEKQTLLLQQQIVAIKQQTLAMKQQTLATEQQIRLSQEFAVQEAGSDQLTQTILVVLGVALIVAQIVGSEPTVIFLRGIVIIGTTLLTTLLIYLLGRARQGEKPIPMPSESEEDPNAPLALPPSDDSRFR